MILGLVINKRVESSKFNVSKKFKVDSKDEF